MVEQVLGQAGLRHGIEGGEGLVQQKQIRLDRQGPADRDALLLAAGQLMGPATLEAGQTQHLDEIGYSAAYRIPGQAGEAEGEILGDAEMGKESVALYHVADPPLPGRHVHPLLGVEEQAIVQGDGSGQRPEEAGETLEGQALAGAGGADDGQDLALGLECHPELELTNPSQEIGAQHRMSPLTNGWPGR